MSMAGRYLTWAMTPLSRWLLALALGLVMTRPGQAQDMGMLDDDGGLEMELEEGPIAPTDLDKLPVSYYSELHNWPQVKAHPYRKKDDDPEWLWEATPVDGQLTTRLFVKPLGEQAIGNTFTVPEAGTYRLWLCYLAETGKPHPVTLTLSGANTLSHVYGAEPLPKVTPFKLRHQYPIRLDSQMAAESMHFQPVVVWEYLELDLVAGETTVTLATADREARVDSVFLSQSLTFVPSKSAAETEGNLNHTWYRYRVRDVEGGATAVNVSSFIHYMWPHYRPPSTTRIWYGSIGTIKAPDGNLDVPVDSWSDWVLVDEKTTNGGYYFSDTLTITDAATNESVPLSQVDVQLAWYPDPGAVLRSVSAPAYDGTIRYLSPVAPEVGYRATYMDEEHPAPWGVRHPDFVKYLRTERQFLEDLSATIAGDVLLDGEMPKRIEMFTTARTGRDTWDVAQELLSKVGINSIPGWPQAARKAMGLSLIDQLYNQSGTVAVHSHDPMDPQYEIGLLESYYGKEVLEKKADGDPDYFTRKHWLKMGDEIGKVTTATHINGLPDCRAVYLDYMRQVANGDPGYFGLESFDHLYYEHRRERGMNRYERRAFYHNRRFIWWFTAEFYRRHTEVAMTHLPNLITRCNYTPGGPTFAGDMDSSNWFALPRYGASTGHSGEDWLSSGNGYTSQAGVQTEAYYAELIDCGARKHGQPKDFIMVSRLGELDRKMMMLVAGGIHQINVYSWGPQYALGHSDSFSQVVGAYETLNRGARALGPAEDYLIDGEKSPTRVALLYNRTNEIWNGGDYGVAADRIFTFLALRHVQAEVDLILEEDLTAAELAKYDVLYLSGLNIRGDAIAPIRTWVEGGGLLIAHAGTAMRDEYDDPLPAAEALLGAKQRRDNVSDGRWMTFYIKDHEPIDTLTTQETDLTPAGEIGVIGLKTVLEPIGDAQAIGHYTDGSVGAVQQSLGQGQVLTFGIMPGLSYGQNAPRDENGKPTTYDPLRRDLITRAALRRLGPLPTTYTEALADITRFDHPDAIAVILVDFTYEPGRPATLTLRTDRQITSVAGTLGGDYSFKQDGDVVTVDCPTPNPVDVILLR